MSDSPLVSVVIATYNMALYLPEAIRSVLDQTYRNVEVVIVDDGSTDNTGEVVKPLLADSRIRYLSQPNKGQAAAKNLGIKSARGDYVAFLDADDAWVPDKLDAQMPLFSGPESPGVVYGRVVFVDERGNVIRTDDGRLHRGYITAPLFIDNFVGFGTCVVRRECFDRLGCFNESIRMGIDYDLWLRFSTAYTFDYVDRPLLHYRMWAGQMSRNCKDRYLSGINIMKAFLRDFPGVVDGETEQEAWAHTFTGFGNCKLRADRSLTAAVKLYLRALRHRPTYGPAWKCLLKAPLLRMRDTSRGARAPMP